LPYSKWSVPSWHFVPHTTVVVLAARSAFFFFEGTVPQPPFHLFFLLFPFCLIRPVFSLGIFICALTPPPPPPPFFFFSAFFLAPQTVFGLPPCVTFSFSNFFVMFSFFPFSGTSCHFFFVFAFFFLSFSFFIPKYGISSTSSFFFLWRVRVYWSPVLSDSRHPNVAASSCSRRPCLFWIPADDLRFFVFF